MRPRHERLLAYEMTKLDHADRHPLPLPLGGDCPDCGAKAGELCFAFCLRYREDPDG